MSKATARKVCDCGAPGQRYDGSGWFCLDCELFVKRCSQIVHSIIIGQRREEHFDNRIDLRRKSNLQFRINHREEIRQAA